jgi:amidohydrolase
MPILNRVADMADEITAWRRDFHQNPELGFDVYRTARVVAEKLRAFGCDEVVTGIGKTGVVAVIKGTRGTSGKVTGLRADMDALPIEEAADVPYKSNVLGKMHACGHDGHTAILLGTAKYLAETRNFDGTAVMIFQPAEEAGGGGDAMVRDGLIERFGIQEVYGMHNRSGMPVGNFGVRAGPMMAAVDDFRILIEGKGGHAARPHECVDSLLVGCQLVNALQSIVSRNVDPLESAVISVCSFKAGETYNVIPQTATLLGTVRTMTEAVRSLCHERIKSVVQSVCETYGACADLEYRRGYPVTVNHPEQAEFMASVAAELVGDSAVDRDTRPVMAAEDFSFMLNARPGALMIFGNGDRFGVHHPKYDFNDDAIPFGVSLWAKLVETRMPAQPI